MTMRIYVLSTLLCFFLIKGVSASHIVGGGISYKCIDSQTYEIKLTIYRDCGEGLPWFDDPVYIAVFDRSSDTLVTSLGEAGFVSIPFSQIQEVPKVGLFQCLNNRPQSCIHFTEYVQTVSLPPRTNGYLLSYQRCCRNEGISNINGKGAVNYTAVIEGDNQCNSSPEIKSQFVPYVCAGEPIDFKIDAIDPDGDSLVFQLSTPLTAQYNYPNVSSIDPPPFKEVSWNKPFGLPNILGGEPLRIDATTGQLTGIPDQSGTFLVGITIAEYRNGNYIGDLKFEMELHVIVCDRFEASIWTPDTTCEGNTIELINLTDYGTFYRWEIHNNGSLDTIFQEASPVLQDLTAGYYQIKLIAKNEHGCSDSTERIMEVLSAPGKINFQLNRLHCEDALSVELVPSDTLSIKENHYWLNWFIDDEKYTNISPVYTTAKDSFKVRMQLSNQGWCKHEVVKSFPSNLLAKDIYPDRYDMCKGDSIALEYKLDPGSVDMTWNPAQFLNANDVKEPIAFPLEDTSFAMHAENEFGCERRDTVQVRVHDPPLEFEIKADQTEILPGEVVMLEAPENVNYIYHWKSSHSFNPLEEFVIEVQPLETALYILIIENQWGCTATDSILIRVDEIECQPPEIFLPNAFSPNGDGVNDVLQVRGQYIDRIHLQIYNRWGQKVFESHSQDNAWKGRFKGEKVPVGTYAYILEVHCINGKQVFRDQGSLHVYR